MKTIIYFLSVLAVVICTSPGLLSQEREIGEFRNGQPVITNAANVALYFKSVHGNNMEWNAANIQWSIEHKSYFLVGVNREGKTSGLQLRSTSSKLHAADGPKLEIYCKSGLNCHLCNLQDAVCECLDVNNDNGSCETMSKSVTSVW